MPEPYRSLAISNIQLHKKDMVYYNLLWALGDAFWWKDTDEGNDYWSDLHDRVLDGEFDKQQTTIEPDHYGGQDNPYEAIKVIKAHDLNFCLGNVIKYVLRAGKKGDRKEDLMKAMKYLEMEIGS